MESPLVSFNDDNSSFLQAHFFYLVLRIGYDPMQGHFEAKCTSEI